MTKLYKRIWYFRVRRDLQGLMRDLARNDFLPETGRFGSEVLLKFVEWGTAPQEIKMVEKELLQVIGDRAELLLVKGD